MSKGRSILALLLCLAVSAEGQEGSVRQWIDRLGSSSIVERDEAFEKLKAFGKRAERELEKALQSGDSEVTRRARVLLRRIALGDRIPESVTLAMPQILDRLDSPKEEAWSGVLLELGGRDQEGTPRHPELRSSDLEFLLRPALHGVSSSDDLKLVIALAADLSIPSAGQAIAPFLEHPHEGVRAAALTTVGKLRYRESLTPALRLLENPDLAAVALQSICDMQAHEAVPALLARFPTEGKFGQIRILSALRNLQFTMAEVDPRFVEAMASLLKDPDASLRAAAVEILGLLHAVELRPQVGSLLGDEHADVRRAACRSLRALEARDFVPDLVKRLSDPHPVVRATAARALGSLGADEAKGRLRELLVDGGPEVSTAALQALDALASRSPSGLADFLKGLDQDRRQFVFQERVQRLNLEAYRVLMASLQSEQAEVRTWARDVFAGLGREESITGLLDALAKGDFLFRGSVVRSVGGGTTDTDAFVERALACSSHRVRMYAASWLCHLGSAKGVPLLLRESRQRIFLNALRSPDLWRRLWECPTMGRFTGPERDRMVAALRAIGLDVEWSESALRNPRRWIVQRRSVLDPEEDLPLARRLIEFCRDDLDLVIEEKRVKFVTSDEAGLFWSQWWLTKTGK